MSFPQLRPNFRTFNCQLSPRLGVIYKKKVENLLTLSVIILYIISGPGITGPALAGQEARAPVPVVMYSNIPSAHHVGLLFASTTSCSTPPLSDTSGAIRVQRCCSYHATSRSTDAKNRQGICILEPKLSRHGIQPQTKQAWDL